MTRLNTKEEEDNEKANKCEGLGHWRNRCMVDQKGVSEHTEQEVEV